MRALILALLIVLGFATVAHAMVGGSWMITGIAAQYRPTTGAASESITWSDGTLIEWSDGTILVRGDT